MKEPSKRQNRGNRTVKTALITRHAVPNYGSLLQAHATQKAIESLGHECEIINYIRTDEKWYAREYTLLGTKSEWKSTVVRRIVYLGLRLLPGAVADLKFAIERKKYLRCSREYHSAAQLRGSMLHADRYITGSDQVWGAVSNGTYDDTYCLSFVDGESAKIAYAAGFGSSGVAHALGMFEQYLPRYKAISVREDSAVAQCRRIGIDAVQVLDPTLLYDRDYWSALAAPKPTRGEYVLVYQLHRDQTIGACAEKIAKEKGLPLIRLSASAHQAFRGGKFVFLPSIAEFLSYIKHASCLVTDSFHGTAFAVCFNTPFVNILPRDTHNDRIFSLLRLAGLETRISDMKTCVQTARQPIDFSCANRRIESARAASLAWLKEQIEDQ